MQTESPALETILFASARASAHFALRCLEPHGGHLRAKSSFVKPDGEIMHWHDFGDLEGPGWAANAVGGAHLSWRWARYVDDAKAQAYLESWDETGDESHRDIALGILRAIAGHHYGHQGFLTEGVDWNNHVSQRHHIDEALYGAIQYTEPLLNNLHFLGPTLFYFEKTGYRPPAELDDAAAIALLDALHHLQARI
jgi:hypothetical protein